MNPQHAVLETAALPLELLAYNAVIDYPSTDNLRFRCRGPCLLSLLVGDVALAELAVLLEFYPLGSGLLVLRRRIVPAFAFHAG